jgi:hypothetical protein
MRSQSESCQIRVEQIEGKNRRDQAFLELWQSRDSNYVGKIIVGGLGEEISAKRVIGHSLFLGIPGAIGRKSVMFPSI